MKRFLCALMVLSSLAAGSKASAQGYTTDARQVAMGGGGSSANIANTMMRPVRSYGVIPVPIGLFQVLGNLEEFNPSSDKFDPIRAIENVSNPIHWVFGRSSDSEDDPQQRFVRDLVNGELDRNLNTYQTFRFPQTIEAEGLASGGYGYTFKFAKKDNGEFHGFYAGAGPYLSYNSTLNADPKLTETLGATTPVVHPNSSFLIQEDPASVQLAMSIIFGYRGRLAFPGESATSGDESRDGIYVAGNYRYLKGFQYLQPDVQVRFDTGPLGLVTVNPTTAPLDIFDLEASKGSGRAVDVGMQVVRGRWEGGFGVNGIGNQIEWSDLSLKRFTLSSLTNGGDFVDQDLPVTESEITVKLPVVTSGNVGFDAGDYSFLASAVHGFNGNSFHGGVERRFGQFAARGGARLSRDFWDPTFGVGFGGRIALDLGFYGTHANFQEKRQLAMAISIRINPTQ